MYNFEMVAGLLPFLREAIGSDAEILLCDTERILYAVNPITDRVKPGNPLGDMERSFMEEETYRVQDSVTNYRALLPSRERLRASTLFLKNEDGSLAGFLTINVRVESLLQVRDMLDALINGEDTGDGDGASAGGRGQAESQPELLNRYEGVTVMVEDIVQAVTDEYLAKFGVPAERLTSTERQKIVHELDRRGVFLVKGSIADVAKRLGCSEVTIYRYLQ